MVRGTGRFINWLGSGGVSLTVLLQLLFTYMPAMNRAFGSRLTSHFFGRLP